MIAETFRKIASKSGLNPDEIVELFQWLGSVKTSFPPQNLLSSSSALDNRVVDENGVTRVITSMETILYEFGINALIAIFNSSGSPLFYMDEGTQKIIMDVDGGSGSAGGTEHLTSLLHFNGTNNSTTFTDELGTTWTASGGAKLSTSIYKFPSASGAFNGSTDYISATVAATNTGDFTKECCIYPTALPDSPYYAPLFSTNGTLWYGTGIILAIDLGGHLVLFSPDGTDHPGALLTTATTVSINAQHHIALERTSNVFSIYIDGVKDSNTVTLDHNLTGTSMEIGRAVIYVFGPMTFYYTGYIDEWASYDYAKYTANFIPSVVPYVSTTQTVRQMTIRLRRCNVVNKPDLLSGEPFYAEDTGVLYVGSTAYPPSVATSVADNFVSFSNTTGALKDSGYNAASLNSNDRRRSWFYS